MKTFILITLLSFSSFSFASMEHHEGLESVPSKERLNRSRGCFRKIQNLGCPHPRDGQEIFNTCLEDKFTQLDQGCQKFFEKLYGKKSDH